MNKSANEKAEANRIFRKKHRATFLRSQKIYLGKLRFSGNREEAIKRDNYSCVECGMTREEHYKKYNRDITVDHIDGNGRYSKFQNNALKNLRTMCLVCHGRKDRLIYLKLRNPNES